MVTYTPSVAESFEIAESSTYKEVITCNEFVEWNIVMTEKMESLHKNQTWVKSPRG